MPTKQHKITCTARVPIPTTTVKTPQNRRPKEKQFAIWYSCEITKFPVTQYKRKGPYIQ
jgi:hypothetical protein